MPMAIPWCLWMAIPSSRCVLCVLGRSVDRCIINRSHAYGAMHTWWLIALGHCVLSQVSLDRSSAVVDTPRGNNYSSVNLSVYGISKHWRLHRYWITHTLINLYLHWNSLQCNDFFSLVDITVSQVRKGKCSYSVCTCAPALGVYQPIHNLD